MNKVEVLTVILFLMFLAMLLAPRVREWSSRQENGLTIITVNGQDYYTGLIVEPIKKRR